MCWQFLRSIQQTRLGRLLCAGLSMRTIVESWLGECVKGSSVPSSGPIALLANLRDDTEQEHWHGPGSVQSPVCVSASVCREEEPQQKPCRPQPWLRLGQLSKGGKRREVSSHQEGRDQWVSPLHFLLSLKRFIMYVNWSYRKKKIIYWVPYIYQQLHLTFPPPASSHISINVSVFFKCFRFFKKK